MFENDWIDILFLISIFIMWLVLFYHSFLVWVAYDFFLKSRGKLERNLRNCMDYPFVSVLIPAHNEEIVIARTLENVLELDYPKDKIQIIPINDQSSDATGKIINRYAKQYTRIQPYHVPKGLGGKGKANTLNLAMKRAKGKVICVFDADNSPEPTTLKYLVAELVSDKKLWAVCGKVRTQNRKRNLLTRFINLEFISHQWMIQGGRWHLHRMAMIPGTNFVIWKKVLEELRGWDPKALTEDTDLAFKIRQKGYFIAFNPFAITWEQEPESWRVWFRQRMRWLQGNKYIVRKYLKISRTEKTVFFHIFYMLAIYTALFYMVIISDVLFFLGVVGLARVSLTGPVFLTWIIAFLLFIMSIIVTLSFEETSENTPQNIGAAVLMYFIYCQMWIVLSVCSMFISLSRKKGKKFWAKTPRVNLERRVIA